MIPRCVDFRQLLDDAPAQVVQTMEDLQRAQRKFFLIWISPLRSPRPSVRMAWLIHLGCGNAALDLEVRNSL